MNINVFKNNYFKSFKIKWIFRNIKQFFKNIKAAYQRATKGIAYYDTWNFDIFLNDIFRIGLTQLKDTTHGYPVEYETMEDWQKEIERIISIVELMNPDIIDGEHEVNDYAQSYKKCKEATDEFFDWMKKHYHDLWD